MIPYPLSLSIDEMSKSYEKLSILNEKEEIKRRTAKARNDLESFLYYVDELNQNEIFHLVSNSSQRERMDLLLSDVIPKNIQYFYNFLKLFIFLIRTKNGLKQMKVTPQIILHMKPD